MREHADKARLLMHVRAQVDWEGAPGSPLYRTKNRRNDDHAELAETRLSSEGLGGCTG